VARTVKWSVQSQEQLSHLLTYWNKRNKSTTYSKKLLRLFKEATLLLSAHPEIGQKTDIENVRRKLVRDYIIFYRATEHTIEVISIWDPRQDLGDLE
jgi:toxin YoeB